MRTGVRFARFVCATVPAILVVGAFSLSAAGPPVVPNCDDGDCPPCDCRFCASIDGGSSYSCYNESLGKYYTAHLLIDESSTFGNKTVSVYVLAKPAWFVQDGIASALSYWSTNGFTITQTPEIGGANVGIKFVTDENEWAAKSSIGAGPDDLAVVGFGPTGVIKRVAGATYTTAWIFINCATYDASAIDGWGSAGNPGVFPQHSLYHILRHEVGHVLGFPHVEMYGNQYFPLMSVMWTPDPQGHFPIVGAIKALDLRALECNYPQERFVTGNGVCDFDPIAFVADFRFSDGRASWSALHEWRSREYHVMGCNSPADMGVTLARAEAGAMSYSLPINTVQHSQLRLLEIDLDGNAKTVGLCDVEDSKPGAPLSANANETHAPRENPTPWAEETQMQTAVTQVNHPTCVVFAPPHLVTLLQTQFADFWNAQGHSVQVVSIPLLPDDDTARAWADSSISGFAAAEGVRFFHLVSDWRDDFGSLLWYASPYWESKLISYQAFPWFPIGPPDNSYTIPPFLIPDAIDEERNTSRNFPYVFSDRPYADLDGDAVPDVTGVPPFLWTRS